MIKSAAYQAFNFMREEALTDLNTYLERDDLPPQVEAAAGQARNDIIRAFAKVESALATTGEVSFESVMTKAFPYL